MKKLVDETGEWTVKGAEMLTIRAFLPSTTRIPKIQRRSCLLCPPRRGAGDETGLTALVLTETKARTPEELQQNISAIEACLQAFTTYIPVRFTDRRRNIPNTGPSVPASSPLWEVPRQPGTTCLIEDIAFHIEDLPRQRQNCNSS